MKKIILLLLVFTVSYSTYSQCSQSMFEQEYDEFDKRLKVEYENRLTFSTFKTNDGTSWIGDHLGIRWNEYYYNSSKEEEDKGWGTDYIELSLWAKIQRIKDCYEPKCWQFSDTYASDYAKKGDGYRDWIPYMKGEIDNPTGFGYVQFLSHDGDVLKIYLKYDDIGTHILLNDKRFERSVDNYNWLKRHAVKKVRFHNAKDSKNLDIEIPEENKYIFKDALYCIEFFKEDTGEYYKSR